MAGPAAPAEDQDQGIDPKLVAFTLQEMKTDRVSTAISYVFLH
jgi:hypothetical protein